MQEVSLIRNDQRTQEFLYVFIIYCNLDKGDAIETFLHKKLEGFLYNERIRIVIIQFVVFTLPV